MTAFPSGWAQMISWVVGAAVAAAAMSAQAATHSPIAPPSLCPSYADPALAIVEDSLPHRATPSFDPPRAGSIPGREYRVTALRRPGGVDRHTTHLLAEAGLTEGREGAKLGERGRGTDHADGIDVAVSGVEAP